MPNVVIGERIKAKRKEKGLTQKQLGERTKMSQTRIHQYENNVRKPKIETLETIASALEAPLSYFYEAVYMRASSQTEEQLRIKGYECKREQVCAELRKLIERGMVTAVLLLPESDPVYVVGEVYWCGYWKRYYTVRDVSYRVNRDTSGNIRHELKSVTVLWADGHVGIHRTELDPGKDYRLILKKL